LIVVSSPSVPVRRFEIAGARSNAPVTTRFGSEMIVGVAARRSLRVRWRVGVVRSMTAPAAPRKPGARSRTSARLGAAALRSRASGAPSVAASVTAASTVRVAVSVSGSLSIPSLSASGWEAVTARVVSSDEMRRPSSALREAACPVTASASSIRARRAEFCVLTSASASFAETSAGLRSSAASFRSAPRPSRAADSSERISWIPLRSAGPNAFRRSSNRGATRLFAQGSVGLGASQGIVALPSTSPSGSSDSPGSKAT
jgi:hypothetical protein